MSTHTQSVAAVADIKIRFIYPQLVSSSFSHAHSHLNLTVIPTDVCWGGWSPPEIILNSSTTSTYFYLKVKNIHPRRDSSKSKNVFLKRLLKWETDQDINQFKKVHSHMAQNEKLGENFCVLKIKIEIIHINNTITNKRTNSDILNIFPNQFLSK